MKSTILDSYRHGSCKAMLFAASLLLVNAGAEAQTDVWDGTTNDFSSAINWSLGASPTITTNAQVDGGICQITSSDPDAHCNDLLAGDADAQTGTWQQDGGNLTVHGSMYLGYNATGTGVYNLNGGVLTNALSTFIGQFGTGIMNINGGTVYFTSNSPTFIGGSSIGGVAGSGTLNLTNGTIYVVAPVSPLVGQYGNSVLDANSSSGTLNIAGGSFHASGLYDTNSTFVLVGSGTANSVGYVNVSAGVLNTEGLFIGRNASSKGVFNLSGSGTVNIGTALINGTTVNSSTSFRFLNGANALGFMNMSGGNLNTETFLAGNNTGECDINQSGGTIAQPVLGPADWRLGAAAGSLCIYNMTGGSLSTSNHFQIAYYGQGAMYVSGGATVNLNAGYPSIARSTGSTALMDITSGGVVNQGAVTTFFNVGERGFGTLNLRGGNLDIVSTNMANALDIAPNSTSVGVVNLLAGTIKTTSVGMVNGVGSSTFNFNGGTLQARASNTTFMQGLTKAYVYSGGAVIDSQNNDISMAQPLLAPPGNGVTSIPVTDAGVGYNVAPIVSITGGGGTNATAVAVTNGTGGITIVITSPGVNYTDAPTVTLKGGVPATAATIGTVTIGANTSGSLTKIGNGALYLNGINTYTGSTLVNAGTLAGAGSVTGPVTVAPGATLAAGSSQTNIGTFTVGASPLTLAAGSTNFMKIDKAGGTNDLLTGMSQITYAGTLVVSNLTEGTLTAGGSFKLYNASTYSGAFGAIVPAVPGSGLTWNTNQLAVNGTLLVEAGGINTSPTNITFSVSSGKLNLSWPADHLGWRLEVQTNSLAVGLGTNWETWPYSTNLTSVSAAINSINGSVFFRLVYP